MTRSAPVAAALLAALAAGCGSGPTVSDAQEHVCVEADAVQATVRELSEVDPAEAEAGELRVLLEQLHDDFTSLERSLEVVAGAKADEVEDAAGELEDVVDELEDDSSLAEAEETIKENRDDVAAAWSEVRSAADCD